MTSTCGNELTTNTEDTEPTTSLNEKKEDSTRSPLNTPSDPNQDTQDEEILIIIDETNKPTLGHCG